MFKKRLLIFIAISLSLLLLISGCTSKPGKTKIKLGYVNWAEGIAMTHLAKVIIEDELGYEVQTVMADVGPIFQGMASGNIDAFMDVWLPVTHGEYVNKLEDDIIRLGKNFTGARIGLVVPTYVEIDSIEDLNQYKDKFDGKIIGIDAGAGIMQKTRKAIEEYGLELELIEGSGPAMAAALKKAIDNGEWIVVTGWQPHWKFARFDLKFLKDPRGVYGQAENLYTYTRTGFEEDAPGVANFLENFSMSSKQLGSLMGIIADGKKPVTAAREWIKNNREVVDGWLNK
ncbi:glycine betaine ABC transporter substrate-binding protein [Halothermothrix orenii]|uniref:Substrate-binding region of ABC-type glycine betaine transport system n=1 Tax=Halothermothrix orenii (strain H 168 / OCM 544 / DSM 9562) TaxID=373903 RepID=B8D0F8_HALOH|nr:glycine betaine ABC transporter substrate-binding protein [Halothermothrix orenii]ACL70894.1 Substrate-binding region of ABC-type glycine betaine transport system [Halothermothrix orenii H 168]